MSEGELDIAIDVHGACDLPILWLFFTHIVERLVVKPALDVFSLYSEIFHVLAQEYFIQT